MLSPRMPSRTARPWPRPTPAGVNAPSRARLRHSAASSWVRVSGRTWICRDQPWPARSSMICGRSRCRGVSVMRRFYQRRLRPPTIAAARQEFFMRAVFALFMLLCSFAVSADDYARLYQSAGWPDQRAHFGDALKAAQQRYQASLPPAVFQALVHNSNRRFEPTAMDQRALATLRTELADPQPALQFFESALGRRIVAAETLATSREQLAAHANGLPAVE